MKKQVLTRRDFLRTTFLVSSAVLVGCAPQVPKEASTATPKVEGSATEVKPKETVAGGIATATPVKPADVIQPTKYNEAPTLAKMVAAGQLPPVDKRLPKEPFVRETLTIGKYGGRLYDIVQNQGGNAWFTGGIMGFPQEVNNEGNIIRPHLCKKVEINTDSTEVTFYFREGLKYSDGQDCDADSILWWWNEEQNNVDIYPNGPAASWKIGGKYATFEKIDKWTVKIKVAASYRPLLNMSAFQSMSIGANFGQPVKYMEKLHIKFNPDADKLAKEVGFEHWNQLYLARQPYLGPFANKPHVGPWVKTKSETTLDVFSRNPYFCEVDAKGNQLPYIDEIYVNVVEDSNLRDAKVVGGEVSNAKLSLFKIDLYRSNMKAGDYQIFNWMSSNTAECLVGFNMNHKDPEKRKIYGDIRFRQAMSYAIDRKLINDTMYFGQAKEYQATVNTKATYFDEAWIKNCAKFDLAKANALLDELGLKWDNNKKYRLLPSGKRLSSVWTVFPQYPIEIVEMVRRLWEAVGMETIIDQMDRKSYEARCRAADHDCTSWNADMGEEISAYMPWSTKWSPQKELFYAVGWYTWWMNDGKSGEEPPQEWKDQFERIQSWYQSKSNEEYLKLGHDVWQFFNDQLPAIGTVAYAPIPALVKNGLQNVEKFRSLGYGVLWCKSCYPQIYYWDEPEKHIT